MLLQADIQTTCFHWCCLERAPDTIRIYTGYTHVEMQVFEGWVWHWDTSSWQSWFSGRLALNRRVPDNVCSKVSLIRHDTFSFKFHFQPIPHCSRSALKSNLFLCSWQVTDSSIVWSFESHGCYEIMTLALAVFVSSNFLSCLTLALVSSMCFIKFLQLFNLKSCCLKKYSCITWVHIHMGAHTQVTCSSLGRCEIYRELCCVVLQAHKTTHSSSQAWLSN